MNQVIFSMNKLLFSSYFCQFHSFASNWGRRKDVGFASSYANLLIWHSFASELHGATMIKGYQERDPANITLLNCDLLLFFRLPCRLKFSIFLALTYLLILSF